MSDRKILFSLNSEDRSVVRRIRERFREYDLNVWIDEENLLPGENWLEKLDDVIKTVDIAIVFLGPSGFGTWQKVEVDGLLLRNVDSKNDGPLIIPVILNGVVGEPVQPWILKRFHAVDLRDCDYGSIEELCDFVQQVDLSTNQDSFSDFTILGEAEPERRLASGYTQSRIASESRLFDTGQREDESYLIRFGGRVKRWIEQILSRSLNGGIQIALEIQDMDFAVEPPPWKSSGRVSEEHILARKVFPILEESELLLILGEPGSGKTTTLLELTSALLERSKNVNGQSIPVVLNLSSWQKGQELQSWSSTELHSVFNISPEIGLRWVEKGLISLMLDGLNEVEPRFQADCVDAINSFINKYDPRELVVCCRLKDYQWLPRRLKMHAAVGLKSLSSKDVGMYIERFEGKLDGLKRAIDCDSDLRGLAKTPFMLFVLSFVFYERSKLEFPGEDSGRKNLKARIFDLYVDEAFERRGVPPWTRDRMIAWLSWLARAMRWHSQSILVVQEIQPSWLGARWLRLFYGCATALGVSCLFAVTSSLFYLVGWAAMSVSEGSFEYPILTSLKVCLVIFVVLIMACFCKSSMKVAVVSGLGFPLSIILLFNAGVWGGLIEAVVVVLVAVLIFSPAGISLAAYGVSSFWSISVVKTFSWNWLKALVGFCLGFVFGVGLSYIAGYVTYFYYKVTEGEAGWDLRLSVAGFVTFLLSFIWGALFGVIAGIVGGISTAENPGMNSDEDVRRARKQEFIVPLLAFTGSVVILGMIFVSPMLVTIWFGGRLGIGTVPSESIIAMTVLLLGPIWWVAFCVALNRGGASLIKHYSLRVHLWLTGRLPLFLFGFLDAAVDRFLLERVGGGYQFIHQTFRDYFAELTTSTVNEFHPPIDEGELAWLEEAHSSDRRVSSGSSFPPPVPSSSEPPPLP